MRADHYEALAADAAVSAAEAIAEALVLGCGFCDQAALPLTELQQIELVKAALMTFDGYGLKVKASFEMQRTLEDIAGLGDRS